MCWSVLSILLSAIQYSAVITVGAQYTAISSSVQCSNYSTGNQPGVLVSAQYTAISSSVQCSNYSTGDVVCWSVLSILQSAVQYSAVITLQETNLVC